MNDSVIAKPQRPLLYRWDHLVLSIGPSDQLKPHRHGAAELRISLESPITCRLDSEVEVEATSLLIPAGVQHQNQCVDDVSAVIYLDVESSDYDILSDCMTRNGPIYVGLPDMRPAQDALQQILRTAPEPSTCLGLVRQHILHSSRRPPATGGTTAPTLDSYGFDEETRPIDRRVTDIVRSLKADPADARSVGELAASVFLSEDRLHHLFSAEVGIPIHRFRLWLRLRRASEVFLSGADLTTAAYESGFADSAHLSRTFVKMFGAPPSRLLAPHRPTR